jgi:hypothetical protein
MISGTSRAIILRLSDRDKIITSMLEVLLTVHYFMLSYFLVMRLFVDIARA